jgi:hypothetical protein
MSELTSEPAATLGLMPVRCSRCDGRMMVDRVEGDAACFNCGNVVYRTPPMEPQAPTRREPRRIYHGGLDIT